MLAILLVVVCGAMAGITFAIVNLSKDTKVDGNLMMSRASSKVVATGVLPRLGSLHVYDTAQAPC